MAECALIAPTVKVNSANIPIIGNSVSYTEGAGVSDNIPESTGGNAVQMVSTRDVSTLFSIVKFSIKNTAKNAELVRDWKSRDADNLIEIIGQNNVSSSFSRSFQDAVLTNDPEIGLGMDSEIALEWKTAPAI